MNLIKYFSVVSGICFALVTVANAQSPFSGQIGIQEETSQTAAFTTSSLMLDISNYTEPSSGIGTFSGSLGSGTVPWGTEVFAYSLNITGLSSTPTSENISDFLIIGGSGEFSSPGTTPNDRFDFDLQSLTEDYSSPTSSEFIGMGILTDTQDDYSPTPAEMNLTFSGTNNYSFTLEVVPEPTTLSLMAVGLLGTIAFRRRKS